MHVVKGGRVHIVTNRPDGILHTEVTAGVVRRTHRHRTGEPEGLTGRYRVHRPVWFEWHDGIVTAMRRERDIGRWPRAWKVRPVRGANRNRDDPYETPP